MNGAEHYVEAERLLVGVEAVSPALAEIVLKRAHVHAMLAVAGATVTTTMYGRAEWQNALYAHGPIVPPEVPTDG